MSDEIKNTDLKPEALIPEEEVAGVVPPEEKAAMKEEKAEKVPFELIEAADKPGAIREFKVTVPWAEYDARMETMIKDLRKNVVIDGFRKGKAPQNLIKRRFIKEISQDIIKEIAPNVAEQILEKEGRKKLLDPVWDEPKVEEGKPIEITIRVELIPAFDLAKEDYTGLSVSAKKRKITEEDINKTIERLQWQSAVFEPKDNEAIEKEDGITVNVSVTDQNGHQIPRFSSREKFCTNIQNTFPEPVANSLIGKKKGEVVEAAVPQTHKDNKGEEITTTFTWKVEILGIKKLILPKVDDDFAKDMGNYQTLDELKKKIREDLERHEEAHARQHALDALIEKIIERKPFDVPQTLVAYNQEGLINEDMQNWKRMGIPLELISLDKEKYIAQKQKDAVFAVKHSFILSKIIEKEGITVSDEDLNAEIAKMAEHEGRKPLAIRAKLEADNKLDALKESLESEKVEQFLISGNSVAYEEVEGDAHDHDHHEEEAHAELEQPNS